MANNKIQVKRTSTAGRTPNTTNAGNTQYIAAGELALNMTDQTFFTSDGTNLIYVGSNVVNQRITNSLTLDNDRQLRFKTVNTSAQAYFVQQNDDNFVFYTTNTSYGARAVWSIYANSITSAFDISTPTRFNGNVTLGIVALSANGSTGSAGQILSSNGSATYWVSPSAASVNTAAQFTWSNLHTFSANVSFTGNGIGLTTNTGAIYLGGISDANWKIGRNTGVVTKWKYTNNTIDIVTANSNLEGMTIGLVGGNSYFETGYLGTFIANTITIGNSSSNSTVNSTVFSGTANNATNLGGTIAASYVQNTDSRTLSGNLAISGTYFNPTSNAVLLGNSTQRWVLSANTGDFSGAVNAASYSVGTAFTANSTVVNAISYRISSTLIANTLGVYHTGTINAESHTVGAAFTANSTLVNAVALSLSTNVATIGTGTYFVSNGNVGIGVVSPSYKLQVNGSFAATTKSFIIDHPTKPDMKLRYGSLEGPENGVYVRGRTTGHVITLPDHWEGLVNSDTITVSLTPIGKSIMPSVLTYDNKKVVLDVANNITVDCFYHIYGERKDVDKLVVEF